MWFAPDTGRGRGRTGFLLLLLHLTPFWGLAMKTGLDRKSLLWLVVAILPLAMAPAGYSQQNPNLDKHGRRIEKRLAKYREGSFMEVDLRDGSQRLGSLGALSGDNFQMIDTDNNKTVTFAYDDVSAVHKSTEYIGEGSEPGHRPRFLVPVLISAAAAAAAVAIVETVR
jgi:hypothetical protein